MTISYEENCWKSNKCKKRPKNAYSRTKVTPTWILALSLLLLWVGSVEASLQVTPAATQLVGTIDSSISLICSSSSKPILCLWKTPYGHVYTLSKGVFAESGRLRHKDDASEDECGLEIVGLEAQDNGQWECEVGSLIGDTFQTASANINLNVKSQKSPTFHEGQTSRQEVGNDVILHCSADREVHLCRWKTPYLNTYIVGEGIYVERGRIQWLGRDPNYDCTIRVANLDLRDAGTWVCEIGSSTKESFQVQTKEFVIDIETPLKLSAPTALMQNANTDATLVCHANKPYDECLWTTPYGKTYSFPDQNSSHEKGRIAYFGFADTDCGIIVRNVRPRDNGGWQCQLHARNGEIFQNATDVVSLFAERTSGVIAQPRSIADYDYKSIDYDSDFDFDRVIGVEAQQRPTKIQLIPNSENKPALRDSTSTPKSQQTSSSIVNLSDFQATSSGLPPPIELSKLTPKGGTTTSVAPPLSVLQGSDSSDFTGVNPLELELLSRISGTRRDSRPIPIGGSNRGGGGGGFESTRTTSTSTTSKGAFEASTKSSIDTMRQLEIQRIRDERRKSAAKEEKEEENKENEEEEKEDHRRKIIIENNRLAERRRKMEEQRRKDAENNKRLLEAAEKQQEEELERKRLEERERDRKAELERQRKEELERQRKEELERQRKEELERQRKEERERQQKIEEERERKRKEELERQRKEEQERRRKEEEERKRKAEEEERRKKIEAERKRKEEEERKRKAEEEERRRKIEEERERKRKEEERLRKIEEEKKKKEEEERKRKMEEERQRKIEEERKRKEEMERRRKAEERRKKQEEERQRRIKEEEERQKKLQEERKRKEEEEKELKLKKQREEEERKRQEEVQRRREEARRQREEERKKKLEEEQRIREFEERRRKEEEERRKALEERRKEEERLAKIEEEKRAKEAEIKRRLEIERKRKEEEERRLAEIERRREEERRKQREEEERKRKEEEERLLKEIERKKKEEEEQRKLDAERKRKEEEELAKQIEEERRKELEERKRLEEKKREEERQRRIELQRQRDEAERQRRLEAEKQRLEEEERQKRLEEEKKRQENERRRAEEMKERREEERRLALERVRQDRIKQEQEEAAKQKQQEELDKRRKEEEESRRQFQLDLRRRLEAEQKINNRPSIQQQQNTSPADLADRASLIPRTESPRSFPKPSFNLPGTELDSKNRCYVTAAVANGNVTCSDNVPDIFGEYSVGHGEKCDLTCKSGYVSVFQKEAICDDGRLTPRLDCVRPDALLLLAGRSDTHGVLNTVELVTARGVCRGAVPTLPAMRWRMIAESIDKDHVLACGGVNIFGDPKHDCWILGFSPEPNWEKATDMLVARDAAAWAMDGNLLIVLGGSLGKLNGYTDSVEIHNVKTKTWSEGPKMSSSRYSHCAVGLGNGSIIVTGGYGGLDVTERLDIDTGKWWPLPELNPVRAQHGCAMVDLDGEPGVLVVGGDSGGTRLKDVRFLPIDRPEAGWQKVADLNTARWGRPGVAMVGGRITVAAGWDGVRDLDTVEYYDEKRRRWRNTASRLQFERRWPASTPISLSLFPKCAQKRER